MGTRSTIADVNKLLQRILDYLKKNNDVSINQREPYKSDMFRIFRDAYRNGLCGMRLRASKDNRRIEAEPRKEHQVTGHRIWSFAVKDGWVHPEMNGDDRAYRNINLVQTWWDEWTYAWDRNPPKRKYVRRNIKSI